MKIVVNRDLCESNAVCMDVEPSVFEVDDVVTRRQRADCRCRCLLVSTQSSDPTRTPEDFMIREDRESR